MIRSFRSKALRRFWTGNDPRGIRPDWVRKVRSFLVRLDAAQRPEDLDTPGSGFHALTGDFAGRYALTVSRNWRLTFAFEEHDAIDLDWKIIMADGRYPLRHPDFEPVHPGEILRDEVFPALEMSISAAASHLGVTRQALHRVLAGSAAVSPEMALRIGKFCGNGPDIWLRMQAAYDLWHASRRFTAEIEKIPTMHEAA